MTGQLDLWAGREVAPGHRVTIRPTEQLFTGRGWRARCDCGWGVGPYRAKEKVVRLCFRHGDLAIELAKDGPIGG